MQLLNNLSKQYKSLLLFVVSVFFVHTGLAQVTGLSNYEIFLDPGHAQTENMGLYNYSEAEKVLRVALEIKKLFETQTDIAKVHMCRLTDSDQISLSARTDLANSLGADFYYSIHSDAGSPSANSTLTMYGGYNNSGTTIEKTPNGGKAYGQILIDDLTGVMRIPTRGHYADRVYYLGNESTHTNQWPYLYVNRTTNMASLLSEAGFHTNPTQQMRNLNAEWKKMEALSAYRSFLQYMGIDRPEMGVVAGYITDEDTGLPINGMGVTIGDATYTTDSYESLFKNYTSDPEALRNGFYFFDDLVPGANVDVAFSSSDYQAKSVNVTLKNNANGRTDENITFVDVVMTSVIPAVVNQVIVEEGELSSIVPGKYIELVFSRKMDRTSVEQAIGIAPMVSLSYQWVDDFILRINTENLAFVTAYTLTVDGAIAKNSITDQFLDGDNNGAEGGDYSLSFTSSSADITAPQIVEQWPDADGVSNEIRPVIRIVLDEKLNESMIPADAIVLTQQGVGAVNGVVQHAYVGRQSVLHFFPMQDLVNHSAYNVKLKAGLEDNYGNKTSLHESAFEVQEMELKEVTVIDGFETGIVSWWQPQASGSTSGIVTEQTGNAHETTLTVKSTGSAGSMELSYGWAAPGSGYIREYLPSSASQNSNRFDTRHVLQAFVFGDGSGNSFRFMIKDGNSTYEASPWYIVDWIGWKLVSWDLTIGTSTAWVNGNGVLDGTNFYLDGIHMTSSSSGAASGTFYFDDLRFAIREAYQPTSVKNYKELNLTIYPNPVRDKLTVKSDERIIEVSVYDMYGRIVDAEECHENRAELNVSHLTSGVYILKIVTETGVAGSKIKIEK
ncbi:N-acetylmuramoyl-L-alanine amidase [Carboxylicivirga sp. RSCT41]|uniref:N-acetylmuramoyl-L-alanine amidase n=1 Tax=Carboxylicivirga agarovorans TaxID=3417570 RepID=UPI003D3334E4